MEYLASARQILELNAQTTALREHSLSARIHTLEAAERSVVDRERACILREQVIARALDASSSVLIGDGSSSTLERRVAELVEEEIRLLPPAKCIACVGLVAELENRAVELEEQHVVLLRAGSHVTERENLLHLRDSELTAREHALRVREETIREMNARSTSNQRDVAMREKKAADEMNRANEKLRSAEMILADVTLREDALQRRLMDPEPVDVVCPHPAESVVVAKVDAATMVDDVIVPAVTVFQDQEGDWYEPDDDAPIIEMQQQLNRRAAELDERERLLQRATDDLELQRQNLNKKALLADERVAALEEIAERMASLGYSVTATHRRGGAASATTADVSRSVRDDSSEHPLLRLAVK